MEVKSGYEQATVATTPEAWRDELLGDHVRITSGESPSLFHFATSGLPYFKVEQLSNSEKHLDTFSTPYHYERGKTVPRGSVIFAKRGAAIALNKVRILAQESFMDTNLMALTPTEELDGEFLYYAIGYIGLWRFADTTSVPQINNKHVKPLPFPLPKLAEQRAIAEVLGDVDALLGSLEQLITKKRDLKQAAMQQLLTGKKRLPGFALSDRLKHTAVGEVPEDWKVQKVGEIATVGRGRVISHREISNALSPLYPVYSSQTSDDGVMGYIDTFDFDGEYITWTTDGANAGTVFHRNGRFNCTNVCGTIKLTRDNAIFVAKVLGRFASRHVSRNLGNPKLMNDVMKRIQIPLPPNVQEQTAIAEVLSDMDAELAALEQRLAKTRDLKQGLMQELLTGRTRLV